MHVILKALGEHAGSTTSTFIFAIGGGVVGYFGAGEDKMGGIVLGAIIGLLVGAFLGFVVFQ